MKRSGLTEAEVSERKIKYGLNEIPSKEGVGWFFLLINQFKSPLIYIILIAGIFSLFFKETSDFILILSVVILNVVLGFYQEFNAQKTLVALKKIIKPEVIVLRNGQRQTIEVKNLVPGDLVFVGSGDKVPADGKIVEGVNLIINEAILTGEEEPVEKNSESENNLVFMGTTIVGGHGMVEILKTGEKTEMGKIGLSLSEIKEDETPLQKQLSEFSKSLALIILSLCFFIFLLNLSSQQEILSSLKLAIILAVAALPEGLPVVITIILTIGMKRVLKKNGLVKKLLSIETLGSVSIICTDKTGTLTEGIMRVVKAEFTDPQRALTAVTVANNRRSGVELALWDYVEKIDGFNHTETKETHKKIYEDPFDSEKKHSVVVAQKEGNESAYMLGAPEVVMKACKMEDVQKFNELKKLESWGEEGLRVIAVAYKKEGKLKEKRDFVWLGLVGIEDPIRDGVKESIAMAQEAGIKVKIITGDYKKTAAKVASKIGLRFDEENIMEGYELETITEEGLKKRIYNIDVFSRVTPHQKLKIIHVLQDLGEIVAMTGDGVNDAPALKKADIGVAVGSATEVAKESAKLIILDNNFKTIIAACEEGRIIFSNIKKVVTYILSNSFVVIVTIIGAIFLDLPAPITITQILWLHLICDGPPDLMLGFEPGEKNIMKEKPRNMQVEKIMDNKIKVLILTISLFVGLSCVFLFQYFYKTYGDINLARTIVFGALSCISLFYVFPFKNLGKPIYKTENFFGNKYMVPIIFYGIVLIFSAIYFKPLNIGLGTSPLLLSHWVPIVVLVLISVFIVEVIKAIFGSIKRV